VISDSSLSYPLSNKQNVVWAFILGGLSVSSIAEKLNTTRQYVNQTRLTADAKLSATLMEVARVNDLQVTSLNPRKGLLVGYHPFLKRKAIITYSSVDGIKIWYWYDNPEEITDQNALLKSRQYLWNIARERGLDLKCDPEMHPARLAHVIFCTLIPELKS
jgi:hypothetical protein